MNAEIAGQAWRTPGARRLVYNVLLTATNGAPCIIRNRREGAIAAFCEAAASDFPCPVEVIDARSDIMPLQAIAELASPGANSAAHARLIELIAGEDLRETIFIVRVDSAAITPWVTFAGIFASARRAYPGPAASLVLLTRDACDIPEGCRAWDDNLVIDPLDALIFVRERTEWPRTRLAQAASAVLVEACRGDLDLIDQFLDLKPEQAFNPMAIFRASPPTKSENSLYWRERDEPCPLWLASKDPARLSQRIWRGQLSVLFPWLEELRTEILAKGGRKLSVDGMRDALGGVLAFEDFEFVQIAYALKQNGAASHLVDAAHTLRLTRNELAHCRPLEVADLQSAEMAARRLIQALSR